MYRLPYILVLLGFSLFFYSGALGQYDEIPRVEPVTQGCLDCLCQAASGCNGSAVCSGDVCGIFRITRAYWTDAGKPTLTYDNSADPSAYSRCVNEPFCAAVVVRSYMSKYAQDCNADGVIDCYDYVSIHKLGGYGCTGTLDADYYKEFLNCYGSQG